jgi:hypothetical protein
MAVEWNPRPAEINHTRYEPGQPAGHYESFFQRANHPERPLAFWIRYTLFSPDQHPERALGELWAIYFDGETQRHVALKKEVPIESCRFARDAFSVAVGDAVLGDGFLRGAIESPAHSLSWDLSYEGGGRPLFLLPGGLYRRGFPKAKSLVGRPHARYSGRLRVDGREVDLAAWAGSQNHNWGSRHTDQYAWGQVAGFDSHPESFLEVATARLKLGPFWTPHLTVLVLRHDGREIALNRPGRMLGARASLRYFDWTFATAGDGWRVEGRIHAPREAFVGLRYFNPPGGIKQCLNTKIASCDLVVSGPGGSREKLVTAHRAAFEILTDSSDHGIPLSC